MFTEPTAELLADLLADEQAYPTYKIEATWIEKTDATDEKRGRFKGGLTAGLMRNSTGWSEMPKEPRNPEEIAAEIIRGWKERVPERQFPRITVKLTRWETWCGGWFDHWTHADGRNDAQYNLSFERFCRRMEDLIWQDGETAYCLMGAEDNWRWHGENQGDPAPCRCGKCTERGVVTIGH